MKFKQHFILIGSIIGIVHSCIGQVKLPSIFTSRMVLQHSIKSPNHTPSVLFNGMVHPLVGYVIKGVTWYQGESNYDRPLQYTWLLASMIDIWRNLWRQGPFRSYYAEIAPFNYAQFPVKDASTLLNSAYLRETQLNLQPKVKNTAMSVLLDAGDDNNIHPANKKSLEIDWHTWRLQKQMVSRALAMKARRLTQ